MNGSINIVDGNIVVILKEQPKYYVEYRHPNGDYFKSPEMTIYEMEQEFEHPFTEEIFVELMKKNFKTRKSVRESNIQIIKEVDGIKTVIYEQKKF